MLRGEHTELLIVTCACLIWDLMIHQQQEAKVESTIEKEGNELEKKEANTSVSKNTDTTTSDNNESEDGKNSEKICN